MPSTPSMALARPLDFSYASNRQAVAGAGSVVLLCRLRGMSWAGALAQGAGAFAAWATARELDPDHAESATAALALAALLAAAEPAEQRDLDQLERVGGAFTALSALRILTASVGCVPQPADLAALTVGAAVCSLSGQRAAALLPAAALAWSGSQQDASSVQQGWAAPVALAAAVLPAPLPTEPVPLSRLLPEVAAAALLIPAVLDPDPCQSRTDLDNRKIQTERQYASRFLALGAVALGAVTGGRSGLRPLAAACAAVGASRLLRGRG